MTGWPRWIPGIWDPLCRVYGRYVWAQVFG